jgi:hypothetical protein
MSNHYPIACKISDPLFCGIEREWGDEYCPPEKQNVPSLVEDINSIGYKLSNSQLNNMKEWAKNSDKGDEWAIYHIGGDVQRGGSIKGHKCLTLIKYPDKKRMVFKPCTILQNRKERLAEMWKDDLMSIS